MNTSNGTITLIGSGEFGEAMGKTYRSILSRLAAAPTAAFLDTPAGFELNADAIYDKAAEYFARRLDLVLQRASFKHSARASAAEIAETLNILRRADFIFAGPGSPSYTIGQWRGSPVWDAVHDRMTRGAHLVFASAAAIAVSTFALPVYEIYKAGHEPYWLDGMNLFAALGLNLVVVPHWNNTEGGTYDTRYCYMGATRFQAMEKQLPADTVVLGIDEYTACVFDLPTQTCRVMGAGNVTLHCDGQEWIFATGETFGFEKLRASGLLRAEPATAETETADKSGDETARYLIQLARALDETDAPEQKRDLIDRAHDTMHELSAGWSDAAHGATGADIAPFIEMLIHIRKQLRAAKQFALADEIRTQLTALGIELQDSSAGTLWQRNENA